jgi:hypothetical protein
MKSYKNVQDKICPENFRLNWRLLKLSHGEDEDGCDGLARAEVGLGNIETCKQTKTLVLVKIHLFTNSVARNVLKNNPDYG